MPQPTSYELAMLAASLAKGEPDESHFKKAWAIYQKASAFRDMEANPESEFVNQVGDAYRKGLLAFHYKSDDECPVRQYLREKGRPMQKTRTVLNNFKSFLACKSETAKPEERWRFDYERGAWSSQEGPDGKIEKDTVWIHTGVLDDLIKLKQLKKSAGGRKAAKKRRSKKKPKPAKK